VLFKLFFAKEYATNKTLNKANKILIKNNKINCLENILCYEKLHGSSANFLIINLNKTIRLPW
jgi:hypothetical protein